MPIPEKAIAQHQIAYNQLHWREHSIGKMVEDLSKGKVKGDRLTHLDPDLHPKSLPRTSDWLPLFGQEAAAQGHLNNQGVGTGDLFLFFGWFKAVEQVVGVYRFCEVTPDLHIIYGWLQVGEQLSLCRRQGFILPSKEVPKWMEYHPHYQNREFYPNNAIYVAAQELTCSPKKKGAGLFDNYRPILQLTSPTSDRRGVWLLPHWFYPEGRDSCLSYHQDPQRWQLNDDGVRLRACNRGQEFVLDAEDYPEAYQWIERIFEVGSYSNDSTNAEEEVNYKNTA